MVLRPTVFDLHIAAIDVASFGEPVEKGRQLVFGIAGQLSVQKSDHGHSCLLRDRRKRPRRHTSTEEPDEIAPLHVSAPDAPKLEQTPSISYRAGREMSCRVLDDCSGSKAPV
jgi:hypothetical protein